MLALDIKQTIWHPAILHAICWGLKGHDLMRTSTTIHHSWKNAAGKGIQWQTAAKIVSPFT